MKGIKLGFLGVCLGLLGLSFGTNHILAISLSALGVLVALVGCCINNTKQKKIICDVKKKYLTSDGDHAIIPQASRKIP